MKNLIFTVLFSFAAICCSTEEQARSSQGLPQLNIPDYYTGHWVGENTSESNVGNLLMDIENHYFRMDLLNGDVLEVTQAVQMSQTENWNTFKIEGDRVIGFDRSLTGRMWVTYTEWNGDVIQEGWYVRPQILNP